MKRLIFPSLILGILFGLSLPGSALAIDSSEATYISLGVSPITHEVQLTPGHTVTGSFRVSNPIKSQTQLDFRVSVAPYSVTTDTYDADFDHQNSLTQLSQWVTLTRDSGTLAPGESADIGYIIKVPRDAPPGGQYCAFIAEIVNDANTPHAGASIVTSARVASLLYATVDGEIHSEGFVLHNDIQKFIFNEPLKVASIVKNTGNIHLPATYTLEVFPLFSDEEVYTNAEKPDVATILPGTQYLSQVSWNESPQLGIFRVRQTVAFGKETSTKEKLVFLCPSWFFMAVMIFFSLCIAWIVYRIYVRRKLAKYANNSTPFQAS